MKRLTHAIVLCLALACEAFAQAPPAPAAAPMSGKDLGRAVAALEHNGGLELPAGRIAADRGGHVLRYADYARIHSAGTTVVEWQRNARPWLTVRGCMRPKLEDVRLRFRLDREGGSILRFENGDRWVSHATVSRVWMEPVDEQLFAPIRDAAGRLVDGLPDFGIDVDPRPRNNEHHTFSDVTISHCKTAVRLAHLNGIHLVFRECGFGYGVNGFANVGGQHDAAGSFTAENLRGLALETVVRVTKPPTAGIVEVDGGDFEACGMLFRLGVGEGSFAWDGRPVDARATFRDVRFDNTPETALKVIGIVWHAKGLKLERVVNCPGAVVFAADPAGVDVDEHSEVTVMPIPVVHEPDGSVRWWDPDRDNLPRDADFFPANWDFSYAGERFTTGR